MSRLLVSLLTALVATSCQTARPTAPPEPRHDQPDSAAAYHASKRAGTDDVQRSYAAARARMRTLPRVTTTAASAAITVSPWTFLGPGNVGGRTRALVIDPVNPQILFAGGVSGGIWKTVDAGQRWEPVGDDLANIAVNSLAMHPVDSSVLYAGTGEGYFREEQRGTALPLRGNGIYLTRDGGSSWTHLETTSGEDFHWVNDIVISESDPERLYAATRTGVWRSLDAGSSWSRVLPASVKGGCLELALRPGAAGDYLYASCGTFEQATVYRAVRADSDDAWEPVLSEPGMGRTSLAIAPSDPDVVYAMAASNEPGTFYQGLLAIYRSDAAGDPGSWTARVTNESEDRLETMMLTNVNSAFASTCRPASGRDVIVTMGWYCNTLAVDPADADRVWAGGVDLFRSDDGGSTWNPASYWWTSEATPAFVHADQHAIVFHPDYDGVSNKTAFFANDGGVFRTDDARAPIGTGPLPQCDASLSDMAFVDLNNNFGVTQFYHGAVFPDGRRFIAGAQDNGTVIGGTDQGTDGWTRVVGGDGGYVAVDPNDPSYVYAEYQFANVYWSKNGGASWSPLSLGLNDEFLFITPFTLDPNATRRLWLGGRSMWRNDTGLWKRASTPLSGLVSAVAVAPGDSNRVVAGTNEGSIVRTASGTIDGGASHWTAVKPRDGFVTSLTFDPRNRDHLWATYAGFGGTHVWRSLDGGATWEPRDGRAEGALPDIPVHSAALDPTRPGRIYLGTDLGVFVSTNDGLTWNVETTGFASVVTERVLIAPGANGPAVYAFTHGRGAWRAELLPPPSKRRAMRR